MAQAARCEGPTAVVAGGARAERTQNMPCMLVTLDVSQLDNSSLKFAKSRNSSLMSVIDEKSQPEMGPYVLRAVARPSTHIRTAACSSALVTKGADDASICASKRSAAAREERRIVTRACCNGRGGESSGTFERKLRRFLDWR